jgi:hypothetical protein
VLVLKQRTALDRSRELRARFASGFSPSGGNASEEEDKEDLVTLKLSPEKAKGKKKGRPAKGSKKSATGKGEDAFASPSLAVASPTAAAHAAAAAAAAANAPAEDRAIFRQLLLNHLTARADSEGWMAGARQFHLARWLNDYAHDDAADQTNAARKSRSKIGGACEESEDDEESVSEAKVSGGSCAGLHAHFADQWRPSGSGSTSGSTSGNGGSSSGDAVVLDTAGTARVVRSLMVKGNFVGSFDQVLAAVLALLGGSSPTLRAKVVKAVAGIVDADPVLMANDQVAQLPAFPFPGRARSLCCCLYPREACLLV